MTIDNAVLHYYPNSPWIAKVAVNLRQGKKIVLRVLLKDHSAANRYLSANFPNVPVKLVDHFREDVPVDVYI